jgi:hypothetical protein
MVKIYNFHPHTRRSKVYIIDNTDSKTGQLLSKEYIKSPMLLFPSSIVSDEVKEKKDEETGENYLDRTVILKSVPTDIDIAIHGQEALTFESITKDRLYRRGILWPCEVGDMHVGVDTDDWIWLPRYLWQKENPDKEYHHTIGSAIIEKFPLYSRHQLIETLKSLKKEVITEKTCSKIIVLKRDSRTSAAVWPIPYTRK